MEKDKEKKNNNNKIEEEEYGEREKKRKTKKQRKRNKEKEKKHIYQERGDRFVGVGKKGGQQGSAWKFRKIELHPIDETHEIWVLLD